MQCVLGLIGVASDPPVLRLNKLKSIFIDKIVFVFRAKKKWIGDFRVKSSCDKNSKFLRKVSHTVRLKIWAFGEEDPFHGPFATPFFAAALPPSRSDQLDQMTWHSIIYPLTACRLATLHRDPQSCSHKAKIGMIYYFIAARCLYHSHVKTFLKFL